MAEAEHSTGYAAAAAFAGKRADVLIRWLPAAAVPLLRAIPQLGRYTIVSAAALGLDFSVYLMLVAAGWRASLAGVLGYIQGLMLHFALSTRYVFKTANVEKTQPRLFLEFSASGLCGLALTAFIIALGTEVLHVGPLTAKVAAVVSSFAAVFVLRRSVVFAPPVKRQGA